MRNRAGKLDVAHALTTHLGQRNLNPTLLAHDAAMLEALVLAAQALIVADRAEDLGAEQAFALRLEGTIVDRLRLFDFAVRPGADHFGRCQADTDGIKLFVLTLLFQNFEKIFQDGVSRSVSLRGGREGNPQSCSSSMLIPSERISLTSTLKDSGIPGSMRWSPSTMFLYMRVRPFTSSDLTVNISCKV